MSEPTLTEVKELDDGAVRIVDTPHGTNAGFMMGRPSAYRDSAERVRWVDEACSAVRAIHEGASVADVVDASGFDAETLAVLVDKTDGLALTAADVRAATD